MIFCLWGAYLLATAVYANVLMSQPGFSFASGYQGFLYSFAGNLNDAPPFARWDSFWYNEIIQNGYGSKVGSGTAGFFPLYPLLIRCIAATLGTDQVLEVGIWISRIALLLVMFTFYHYARSLRGSSPSESAKGLLALVCNPVAFIFVSVYTESLFALLLLISVYSYRTKHHKLAAVAAFLTGFTRLHSIILSFALLIDALWQRRNGDKNPYLFLPALGGLVGLSGFFIWLWRVFGTPRAFFMSKGLTSASPKPWEILGPMGSRLDALIHSPNSYTIDGVLQYVVPAAAIACAIHFWGRRMILEASLLVSLVGLSVLTGSFWGILRFSLGVLPVVFANPRLTRPNVVFFPVLLIWLTLQAGFIASFVRFDFPAP